MSDEQYTLDVQDARERKPKSKPTASKPTPKLSRSEQLQADLLDALARSRDGLTQAEATQLVGAGAATVRRALSTMHENGTITSEGTRKSKGSRRALPVYRARKSKGDSSDLDAFGRSKAAMRAAMERDRNPRVERCPACGGDFVWQHVDGAQRDGLTSPVACDPQRRIVVFAGPYDEHDLPVEPLTGWEEGTGRFVCGRAANDDERKHYRKHGNLDGVVPWTIIRGSHFTKCTRWDLWLSGAVTWRDMGKRDDKPRRFSDRYKR